MSVQEVADRVGALARRIRDEESLCSKFNCQTALTSDLDEENILFYAKRLTESERADAAALSLLITYPESERYALISNLIYKENRREINTYHETEMSIIAAWLRFHRESLIFWGGENVNSDEYCAFDAFCTLSDMFDLDLEAASRAISTETPHLDDAGIFLYELEKWIVTAFADDCVRWKDDEEDEF